MAFLNSNNIKVFPCGGRNKSVDPFARLTTEYNLVSIINRLVDKQSFLVTTHAKNLNVSDISDDYIINIGGYLFTINGGPKSIIDAASNDTDNKYIIAQIQTASYGDYQQLSPLAGVSPNKVGIQVNLNDTSIKHINYEYNKDEKIISYQKELPDQTLVTKYAKDENGLYYECDAFGVLFDFLPTDYEDQMLDDGTNKFIGIEFLHSNEPVLASKYQLTIFEYAPSYKENLTINSNDNNYYIKTTIGFVHKEYAGDLTSIDNKKYSREDGWVEYEDSKIKFRTTADGLNRSVAIDDGELTSDP